MAASGDQPPAGEPSADKVTFAYISMAMVGRESITPDELLREVQSLQARSIVALLTDESGVVRNQLLKRLRNLWAVAEEHDVTTNPWEV